MDHHSRKTLVRMPLVLFGKPVTCGRGVLALAIYRTESGALISSIWARNLIVCIVSDSHRS